MSSFSSWTAGGWMSKCSPGNAQASPSVLFYWARLYTAQLSRGDHYSDLEPCVTIFILGFDELRRGHFHSKFQVLDVTDRTPRSESLEIHLVALPNLPQALGEQADPALIRWGQFFSAEDDEQLEVVAMADPVIRKAKGALEFLSKDPDAQELARVRELGLFTYHHSLHAARLEGREEGRQEGLQNAIVTLCDVLGIELDAEKRTRLSGMSSQELERLHSELHRTRAWPEPLEP